MYEVEQHNIVVARRTMKKVVQNLKVNLLNTAFYTLARITIYEYQKTIYAMCQSNVFTPKVEG